MLLSTLKMTGHRGSAQTPDDIDCTQPLKQCREAVSSSFSQRNLWFAVFTSSRAVSKMKTPDATSPGNAESAHPMPRLYNFETVLNSSDMRVQMPLTPSTMGIVQEALKVTSYHQSGISGFCRREFRGIRIKFTVASL
jgi:hypothetical protein